MRQVVHTWEELREEAPEILSQLSDNPAMAVAALANPVNALERLGISIAADVYQIVVDRLRLGPEPAERLLGLRKKIRHLAGHDVQPQSPQELAALFHELEVDHNDAHVAPLLWRPGGCPKDPLEKLVDKHPIVPLLVEYRRLDARRPLFAPPEVIDQLLTGRMNPVVTSSRPRFKGKEDPR